MDLIKDLSLVGGVVLVFLNHHGFGWLNQIHLKLLKNYGWVGLVGLVGGVGLL